LPSPRASLQIKSSKNQILHSKHKTMSNLSKLMSLKAPLERIGLIYLLNNNN
jgi:hypothetical protein